MKSRAVIISDDATADLDAGKAFYDSREMGVGSYFIDCLISDLECLAYFAGIHNTQYGYFRMLSKRFPFAIYYETTESAAIVIAILDMRHDPAWMKEQMYKRKD